MNTRKLNEKLQRILSSKKNEAMDEYKEYHFTFVKDSEGNVTIDADDYEGQYREWQDEENDEEMENVIDIAKDERIKDDIEEMEGREVDYIDLIDFDYDEDDAAGSFTLGVTFDEVIDESFQKNESFNTYAVQYQVFNNKDQLVTKQKEFKTEKARANWIAKQEQDNANWSGVLAFSDPTNESLKEDIEEENEKAENKRKKRIYQAAMDAIENLKDLLEEGINPATGKLDAETGAWFDKLGELSEEIYSRSLAFES